MYLSSVGPPMTMMKNASPKVLYQKNADMKNILIDKSS